MTMLDPAKSRPFSIFRAILLRTNGQLSLLLAALLVLFTLLIGTKFLAPTTMQSMAFQLPELGILSLAMMITLLKGGLNLSIIATANFCALTMAYCLAHLVPGTEGALFWLMLLVSFGAGLIAATIIGLINGYVIAYLGVSPILATLGTMTLVKGISIGLTRGNVLSGFPEPVVFIGNGTVYGLPFAMFVFIACAIPVSIWLARTPTGNAIYMIGSNEKATRYSGVDTRKVMLKVYVVSSLLACVAAVVMMARFNSANATYGESYLLVTILAAVLGGIDPFGGAGKVMGLILSLVILQVISSAFNLLGLSQFLTLSIWGVILVAATAIALRYRTTSKR